MKLIYFKSTLSKFFLKIPFKFNKTLFRIMSEECEDFRILPLKKTKKNFSYKIYNIGTKNKVLSLLRKISNKNINLIVSQHFNIQNNLEKKINILLASKLPFHKIGFINIYQKIFKSKKNKVTVFHSDLLCFLILKFCFCDFKNQINYFVPFDYLESFLKINIFQILTKLLKKQKKIKKCETLAQKTAIFFHNSKTYGNKLYTKKHLVKKEPNSPLSKSNVKQYFLPKKNFNIPWAAKIKNIFKTLAFSFSILGKIRRRSEIIGILILTSVYYEFLFWKIILQRIAVKNIIFDYDVLVPKALCLACESAKVNTLALQERPQMSFNNFYGLILNHYFYGAPIYKKYGLMNYFHQVNQSGTLPMWRTNYFFIPQKKKIKIWGSRHQQVNLEKRSILFLGYFLDKANSNPLTSKESCLEFLKAASTIMQMNPNYQGILRFKETSPELLEMARPELNKNQNLFICADYRFEAISYQLCKGAALIISLPSSLAEEALLLGKKVLFLNRLGPFKNIASSTYPKTFHSKILRNPKKWKMIIQSNLFKKSKALKRQSQNHFSKLILKTLEANLIK